MTNRRSAAAQATATPRTIVAASVNHSQNPYRPDWIPVRPGSQDHEKIPSLHCGVRTYRDGRQEVEQ